MIYTLASFVLAAAPASGGSSFDSLWMGLGGLGTFLAALVTAYVVLRKYGPEVNKVQIESANAVVEMARTAADMNAATAKDLRERNQILDNRLTELAKRVGQYEARIAELEKVADLVDELKKERQRLMADNRRLTKRVTDLEKELALLKQEHALTNTSGDIPVVTDEDRPDLT